MKWSGLQRNTGCIEYSDYGPCSGAAEETQTTGGGRLIHPDLCFAKIPATAQVVSYGRAWLVPVPLYANNDRPGYGEGNHQEGQGAQPAHTQTRRPSVATHHATQ
jgi:hypothetical protein